MTINDNTHDHSLETEWAAMKYADNLLTVTKKGKGFDEFKKNYGPEDRGYGYIRLSGGEDGVCLKRPKFVFVTWCGESVAAMQRVSNKNYDATVTPADFLSLIIPSNNCI